MNIISETILIDTIHEVVKSDGFVIIPGWGAFFLQPTAARWDIQKQVFYAPGYQMLFNPRIQDNDGVLSIRLAKAFNCSYFNALQEISNIVIRWNTHLYQWGNLKLENLGLFVLQKDVVHFESELQSNNFPEYYGLQNIYLQEFQDDRGVLFSYPKLTSSKQLSTVVKTLVLVPLVLTLALLPSKINNYRLAQSQSSLFSPKVKWKHIIDNPHDISSSIDTMTNFKVALQMGSNKKEPIKATENKKQVAEEKTTNAEKEIIFTPQHKYFVIIGSFTNDKQVNDYLNVLKNIHIDGIVLNCEGKLRVALGGYEKHAEAIKALEEFKQSNPSYSGWVLNW